MVVKKRPEDLTNVVGHQDIEATRNVTRISLLDLPDEIPGKKETDVPLPPETEAPISIAQVVGEKPITKKNKAPLPLVSKPAREVVENVMFDRSFVRLYIYKMSSFLFIMTVFEVLVHGLKYFDGVDILDPANFSSFFFGTYTELNILKVLLMILVVYLMTPYGKLIVNRKGILCHKVDMMYFFFTSQRVFLKWGDIARVEYHLRFFEPHLFFYDKEGKVLGQIDFSLRSPRDFYSFVDQNVGKNHPINQTKKGPSQ